MSQSTQKILVMDDEDIVADIAEQMLSFLGYDVSIVENGEDAIEQYRKAFDAGQPYSLVIMDLNIPSGMGGIEAIKHLLDIDGEAKVLVSSGYTNDPIMQEHRKHGFAGCIAKPFDLNGLKSAIQAVIG